MARVYKRHDAIIIGQLRGRLEALTKPMMRLCILWATIAAAAAAAAADAAAASDDDATAGTVACVTGATGD